ncbi:MAG: hypothetical protein ABFC85_05715 [Rectinema sp.]
MKTVSVSLRYLDSAAILGDCPVPLELQIHNPRSEAILVEIGVSNTGKMRLWVNGELRHTTMQVIGLRSNLGNGGGDGSNYCNVTLFRLGYRKPYVSKGHIPWQ